MIRGNLWNHKFLGGLLWVFCGKMDRLGVKWVAVIASVKA